MSEISISQHLEEIKETKRILRELERTVETNGCYCPFNKTYPWQAKVIHEVTEILRNKLVKDDP